MAERRIEGGGATATGNFCLGGRRCPRHFGGAYCAAGELEDLPGIDPVWISNRLGVELVDLWPLERIAEVGLGEVPERVTLLDHVCRRPLYRRLRDRGASGGSGERCHEGDLSARREQSHTV